MRLVNTKNVLLDEFPGDDTPPYAILSHRWEKEEVSFDDIVTGAAGTRAGYPKILGACRVALADGWQFVWTDSVCINKASSAELSEAINSMFKWVRTTTFPRSVCI